MEPFLRPTAVQRMRTFLLDHDPIPGWTSSTDVRDHLIALLNARKDDQAFWTGLQGLASDLQEDLRKGRAHGLPSHDAEVFTDHEIGALIRELHGSVQSKRSSDVMHSRSPALLACLAVLGATMAPACTPSPQPQPTPVISADPARASAPDASADASGDALVELFRDGSPADIAAALEAMVDAPADAADAGARKVGTQTQYKPPPRPIAVPRYKGITF